MANVNDARNARGRYERECEKLDEAVESGEMSEQDRAAIEAWGDYKKRRTGSIGTITTYLNNLRISAKRADKPLVEFESVDDVEALIAAHENAGCRSASGLNTHLSALRGFLKWLGGTQEHGRADDYRWVAMVENVKASDENPGREAVDPEFVLSEEEVVSIREAADHPRDKALVEFLADAGPRITLACQMRVGEVDVNNGTFRPNPDGIGHKKVPNQRYRLHESLHQLRRWVNEYHPESPNPPDNAPLFPIQRGYDPAEREDCALSPSAAEDALRKVADAAGIDPDRAHPHNWRRTAVTRMRTKHDLSWDTIQLRTGWSDQSLAEMKETYRRIDEADKLAIVDRELGTGTEGEADDEAAEPVSCVNCGTEFPAHLGTICPGCGTDQDLGASVEDGLAAIIGMNAKQEFKELISETIRENPELAQDAVEVTE